MEAEACALAPEHWLVMPIAEVCTRVTSGGTPSRRRPEFFASGRWPWVKTQELVDRWIDDTEEHITDAALEASAAKVLPPRTILLAMYGATVGQLGLLRREMTCNQACCALVVDEAKADSRYVYYQLLAARPEFKRLATGAAQQNLSGALVREFRLPFPPIAEQRAIAHILGTLDDKIELNRRTNETLEAMARALFKSWFVDFDPVRAKAAGRQPVGMDAATAALFPREFVDSDVGEIPKGWPVSMLGDSYSWSRESLDPAHKPTGKFEHFSLPAFDNGKTPAIDLGATIKSLKFVVMPESVLVSKLNPSICRVWLPFPSGQGIAVSSTEFLVAVPKAGTPRSWLYEAFTSDPIREALVGQASGTSNSHQRVRPDDVDAIPIALPGQRLLARFDAAASPLLCKTNAIRVESVRLGQIRDALLPRLLSGELTIPNAERIVGAAT